MIKMITKTHALKPSRIIVAALTAAIALVSTMAFLTAVRTQAAPLLSTGDNPKIRFITMTADLPHYDPTASDGITKTVYFSNSVSGLITMTFDISGTQTLTLTAGAAFSETERVYTSSSQTWIRPITYSVASTHTTQPNITYTAARTDGFTTTVAITYVRDVTAPASSIAYPSAGQYVSGTQLVVTGTAQDNSGGSGLKRVQITTGTTSWVTATGDTTWTYTWTLPTANNVVYTISARAEDWLDIVQSLATTQPITVDNVPPTGTVILTPSLPVCQWTNENTLHAQWGGFTDGGGVAGYQYLISNTIVTLPLPGATFVTMSDVTEVLPDGEWYFHVAAQDTTGNWSTTHYTGLLHVDTVSPTNVTITAPEHTSATQFIVSWSADDAVSYTVEYSGTDYMSWQPWLTGVISTEAEFLIPATETDYIFRVTAYDHASNSAQAQTEAHVGAFRVYLPLTLRNYAPFANGSFESGWTPWEHAGELNQSRTQSQVYEGQWAVLLGDSNYTNRGGVPVGSGRIWQTFTVPDSSNPSITIWYHIYTHDVVWGDNTNKYYDSFEIYINTVNWSEASNPDPSDSWRNTRCRDNLGTPDANNPGLVFCYGNPSDPTKSNPPKGLDWRSVTLDLSQFKGQNITLYLATFNRVDGWYNTWTYVDDISLQE
ncbi:MAG: Ig-like domain-containing protein [Chloroflexota bacterium]|nr:Ig-like domain-containing protein [Chloroflexota bacterium]